MRGIYRVGGAVMKPGGGRRKGHQFERDVANVFRAAGYDARRGLQGRDGAEAPDVEVVGLSWWIECKAGGPARDPEDALEQAEIARDNGFCVAICRRDRQEPTATVRLFDLIIRCCRGAVRFGGVDEDTPVTMPLDDFVALCVATEPPPERKT